MGGNGTGGISTAVAGNGGDGLEYDISGTATWYAGGGGGSNHRNAGGFGGEGGGGRGAMGTTPGVSGTDGFGGGGGGGYGTSAAGHGGSGTVIVRYEGDAISSSGTVTNPSGATVHTFSTTGSTTLNTSLDLTALTPDFLSQRLEATLSGNLTGTGGIALTGGGTLVLSGDSDYTGDTTVSEGILRVNGSITSDVGVNGGTLGGSGSTGGIAVQNGGIVAPGNSIGTLTVESATFNDGTLSIELGTGTDTLVVLGDLNLTDGNSILWLESIAGWAGYSFDPILQVGGTTDGWFGSVYYNGDLISDPFQAQSINGGQLMWDGGDLLLIPEPASALLLGFASLVLTLSMRRRKMRD